MDIAKKIKELDTYFENTPKEHFEEIWEEVKKYEAYGLDVDDFLHAKSYGKDNIQDDLGQVSTYIPLPQTGFSSVSTKV